MAEETESFKENSGDNGSQFDCLFSPTTEHVQYEMHEEVACRSNGQSSPSGAQHEIRLLVDKLQHLQSALESPNAELQSAGKLSLVMSSYFCHCC